MNEIMVSILCMAYNHEKYIKDALEGFINQKTNFRYEVIVHDDASTDKTAEIIKEYVKRYPDIIKPILQKENQYSQGNYIEKIIQPYAKGKYIAICEGDDYWCDDNKLQMQIDVLENNLQYGACVHQTKQLNCKNNRTLLISPYKKNCDVDVETVLSGGGRAFHTSSILVRRDLFFNKPDFCNDLKTVGDWPLVIYIILSSKIYYIDKIMSVYRLFSTDDAWSSKMNKSIEFSNIHNLEVIRMLKKIRISVDIRYKNILDKKISDYAYAYMKNNLCRELFFTDYFKKQVLRRKIKLIFKYLMLVLSKKRR